MREIALSIVVPTRGTAPALLRLVNSLSQQALSAAYEIFIVENLKGDLSPPVRAHLGTIANVRIATAGQVGANSARNSGLSAAHGAIVLLLDDDCELPHPQYLQEVLTAHRRSPEVCAIGGSYLSPARLSPVARAYQELACFWIDHSQDAEGEQLQLLGGCVSYKRQMLLQKNLTFNPQIRFGGTESDLHERMLAHGLRLQFQAQLSNIHHCQISLRTFLCKAFMQGLGHSQRARLSHRRRAKPVPYQDRPQGFWVSLYDLAFVSGQSWSAKQSGYFYPSQFKIFTLIALQAPRFLLKRQQLDRESLQWKRRVLLQRIRGRARHIRSHFVSWLGEARRLVGPIAEWRGRAIAIRWALVNFRRDMTFALLGYGNHRVMERFELKPQLPPQYFAASQVVRLNLSELENLDEVTLGELCRYDRAVMIQLGDQPVSAKAKDQFLRLQPRLHGVFLTLNERFDFRRALALWKFIKLPVFLDTDINPECLDKVYDHLKNIFYMAQIHTPKAIYSSCIIGRETAASPNPAESNKVLRTQASTVKPRFSFVIPAYGNSEYICRVLEHLSNQLFDRGAWEVVVVDDGSEVCLITRIETWLATQPKINLSALHWSRHLPSGLRDDSFRAGRARNLGVQEARGEWLVFLDSDILVAPDFLQTLEALISKYDVVQFSRHMVQNKPMHQLYYSSLGPGDTYRESSYWEDFKRASHWTELKNYWKYTCTYCLAISHEDYLRAGGFKTKFTTYGFEDVDIGYRLASLGRRFHLSKMPVYHLFPIPTKHSAHFSPMRRQSVLAQSCRQFFLLNLDPEIYRDLYSVLSPPLHPLFMFLRYIGQHGRQLRGKLARWPRAVRQRGITAIR